MMGRYFNGGGAKLKSLPTDERRTPRWFFKLCDSIWGPFDLDACAADWNHQVKRYHSLERSLFESPMRAKAAWMNPLYSRGNLNAFIGFARELVLSGHWERCVLLHPVDPSSQWWLKHVARPEGRVLGMKSLWGTFPPPLTQAWQTTSEGLVITQAFPDRRLAFVNPEGSEVYEKHAVEAGAMQPSAVTVFERRRLRVRSAA